MSARLLGLLGKALSEMVVQNWRGQAGDRCAEDVARARLKLLGTRLACRRAVKREGEREILGVGIDSLSDCL